MTRPEELEAVGMYVDEDGAIRTVHYEAGTFAEIDNETTEEKER